MSIAVETNEVTLRNIAADIPVAVAMPLFSADDVLIFNARTLDVAVKVTDYTVQLDKPYDTFAVVFTADYTAANGLDDIVVRRVMDYETSATPALASRSSYVAREIERSVMRDQQLAGETSRSLRTANRAQPDIDLTSAIIIGDDKGEAVAYRLPPHDARKGGYLRFNDVTGNLEVVFDVDVGEKPPGFKLSYVQFNGEAAAISSNTTLQYVNKRV